MIPDERRNLVQAIRNMTLAEVVCLSERRERGEESTASVKLRDAAEEGLAFALRNWETAIYNRVMRDA